MINVELRICTSFNCYFIVLIVGIALGSGTLVLVSLNVQAICPASLKQ